MSVSEKLQQIAENEQRVYDAGKRVEKQRFWESYQQSGKRSSYVCAFGWGWTDDIYDPIYPIIGTTTNGVREVFRNSPKLTNTKVPIIDSGGDITALFNLCTTLKTVPLLRLEAPITIAASTFDGCSALESITIEGKIDIKSDSKYKGFNLEDSPKLSTESVQSIIDALVTITDEVPRTIQFHQAVRDKLTPTQEDTIVNVKKWTLLPARTEAAE